MDHYKKTVIRFSQPQMPKLDPETHAARREHIIDAAERAFVRHGFHATTMHDICREAGVSPGGLYTYFASKEQLIVGLCDREKDRFSKDLAKLSASPNFIFALQAMAEHFCVNEPYEKLRLHLEIGAEAGRNETIGRTVKALDDTVRAAFIEVLRREKDAGRIAPELPIEVVVRAMSAMGDGLFWQRALDPAFDPTPVIPALMTMVSALLKPISPEQSDQQEAKR